MDATSIIAACLGGMNVWQFVLYLRTAKSQIRKELYSADQQQTMTIQSMQAVYKTFVEDTQKEIESLRQELFMVHETVKGYKEKCSKCTHNETK